MWTPTKKPARVKASCSKINRRQRGKYEAASQQENDMSLDRILQMIFRMVSRKLIGRGVNAGINKAMGSRKSSEAAGEELTPQQRGH